MSVRAVDEAYRPDRHRVVPAVRCARFGIEAVARRVAFLLELKERHDPGGGVVGRRLRLPARSRGPDLIDQLEYTGCDKTEKWFQTLEMRLPAFTTLERRTFQCYALARRLRLLQ